ncbi:hypothetical protein ACF8O8_21480 [Pseudomonas sp. TYF_14]|uniref:hypothetical protein n=1 Tax=Pseudomonas sp. TYF_14 TaxID=3367193 RepID=UPI00370A03D4
MTSRLSKKAASAVPDLDGNKDLFNQLMAKVSLAAGAKTSYCELVVVQMLFHFAREACTSDIPLSLLKGVVEAAVVDVEQALVAGGAA